MKQTCYRRIILLVVIQFLVFSGLVFSSSTLLTDLKIPSQIGSIKEVFENNSLNSLSTPTIIQIQDAHCNYEAQKNLATILEYLIKEKNVKLVLVEGGSGNVTLSFLRSYAEKKDRELIADKYLRSGKISGEEYLDIVSDYNFELYGIEDPALYQSNLDSFLNIEVYRNDALKETTALRKIVDALKPEMYSEGLKDFEQQKNRYQSKQMTLAEYSAYLKDKAERINLKIEEYSHIDAFVKSVQLEKEIDFKEAEAQRGLFIKELAKTLTEPEVKELIARTQDYKAQKISNIEYYAFLKSKAEGRINIKESFPQINSYMFYIELGNQIKPEVLIKDISVIENKIKEALISNKGEKELCRISDSLDILERFLKLDLTPGEYENFISCENDFKTSAWMEFLAQACQKYGITDNLQDSDSIDGNIDKFNDFYRIGLEREQSFMKNIADKMAASGDKVAVVITGGFHTSGMSKLFKDNGYSYAVVTPAITEKADPAIYYSILRGETGRDDTTTDSDSEND
ncbi:MAG: hypothetical protein NTY14_07255 [Candidatus Omnitrophica bacterium]|nr:hypothetical protein [Candidatus Omnitrophota bacterium]